ncbi:MAG: DUF4393 domain-containing protein [Gammaproteobacteria bacterium]|nr:MAG: DUF4393 domain-containing protein [Gammaproteobacteria bacterium]
MTKQTDNEGLDLIGLGKLAKAIPEDVYKQTTEVAVSTFTKLIAPITESTSGLGRYIRQKFDHMVEVEKAIAVYSIQNAVAKAEAKAGKHGLDVITPIHAKSFIMSIEECAKETDPTLHEMWENLIADQLINNNFHPHFVKILSHFSPAEARLLISLHNRNEVGDNQGGWLASGHEWVLHWVRKSGETQLNNWTYSCDLLREFHFADTLAPMANTYKVEENVTVLFRTKSGNAFLKAVSNEI